MQLLFVHERFGALAGAEANILLTATELKRRGHRVALAHGASTGKAEAEWARTFRNCFPLEGTDAAAAIRAVVAAFSPDAIYLHKMADLEVLAALADCGTPVVRMVHDHEMYCMRGYKYFYFNRHICERPASLYCVFPCGAALVRCAGARFPLRWASYAAKRREIELNRKFARLLVASEYMRGELLRNNFAPEQVEIHAPVPASAEGTRSSFSPLNRIIYAGQVVRGKGVDVLLQALARVRLPFECLILGDGNHRPRCEELCRELGLGDRVRFLGFVPQREIANYYRDASVAVMSSLWPEPFGAVGLEAMRCGLPVVAFDAGGIREWLIDGWNGYLVPWRDETAFAARIEELLCDKPLARQMGERGRALAGERFGFDGYVSGLENLFARLAEKPAAVIAP